MEKVRKLHNSDYSRRISVLKFQDPDMLGGYPAKFPRAIPTKEERMLADKMLDRLSSDDSILDSHPDPNKSRVTDMNFGSSKDLSEIVLTGLNQPAVSKPSSSSDEPGEVSEFS